MHVLLLNASFEPLRVITVRRAVGLLLADKAEVIEVDDRLLRSVSAEIPMPVVMRLRRMVVLPFSARAPLNRRTLTVRDGGRCQVSGCDRRGTTIDHVIPRSRHHGNPHRWDNVVLMCAAHNNAKGDHLLDELGWTLRTKPRAPDATIVLLAQAGARPDERWAPYLPVPAAA